MWHDLSLMLVGVVTGLAMIASQHIKQRRRWKQDRNTLRILWRMTQSRYTTERAFALNKLDEMCKQMEE